MIDHLKLRKALLRADKLQYELARDINKRESYISKLYNADYNITTNTLNAICKSLGCKADDILKD